MYVCMCIHVHVYIGVLIHACMCGGQRSMLAAFLYCSLLYFWRQGLPVDPVSACLQHWGIRRIACVSLPGYSVSARFLTSVPHACAENMLIPD